MVMMRELEMYKNFDELAEDVIGLAKEILPDQLFYLSSISEAQQIILKHSPNDTSIPVAEGLVVDLDDTICQRVDFINKQPLVYEDTKEARELDDVRHVVESANVRSYLGIPISFVNGERFGTLCAVNDKKSRFDDKSISLLQRIVRMFSYYLDLERFAYRDSLTDLYNRHFLTRVFEGHAHTGGTVFFLDLDGFKKVNDIHGHDTGDLVLKEVAAKLQQVTKQRKEALAFRIGGDEFLVHFATRLSEGEMNGVAGQLLESLAAWDGDYELSTSIGIASYTDGAQLDLKTLLKQADDALYCAKKAGKNRHQLFEAL